MICSKCGMENNQYASFCIRCGESFSSSAGSQSSSLLDTVVPIGVEPLTSLGIDEVGSSKVGIISLLGSIMIKPRTVFKNGLQKISNFKDSVIIVCLILGLGILMNLCMIVFSFVRVVSYDIVEGKTVTNFVWNNIASVEYGKVIGNALLQLTITIAVIVAVFYVVSILMKKKPSFNRVLVIIASSFIPYILFGFISSFLGLIYVPIQLLIFIIGILFSFVLLYELINDEVGLDGNLKVFYNFICFSILILFNYIYVLVKFKSLLGGFFSFWSY